MATPPNPYSAPASTVADIRDPAAGGGHFGLPAATLAAGRGAGWIGEGWALFKAAPLMWIVALLVLVGIQMLLGLVPVLGGIVSLLIGPMLMVGTLAFAHGIAEGEPADLGRLFAGFKDKVGPLVTVSLLYFVLIIAVAGAGLALIVLLLGGSQLMSAASPEAAMGALIAGGGGVAALVLLLAVFGALMLVAAAYWYAPGLVFYANLGAWDAMKASFSACLRNWLPFLVYGLLGLLVCLLGMVALFIGFFLVSLPVLMASYYSSFRDIFGQRA